MAKFLRLRSLWGVEPGENLENWARLFPDWKTQGYGGVEVDIYPFDTQTLEQLRALCDKVGFEIGVTIFSSWPQYAGPRPINLTPEVHLDFYRQQLLHSSVLRPVRINAQSGADYWTLDESVRFYKGTFGIDRETGVEGKVTHETHRNRSLFNPQIASQVLRQVPELRITADISHWVVVSERLLDVGEEDSEILNQIIPHVQHIHARIGTTQSSQCPEPTNPAFSDERDFFERLWKRIIKSLVERNREVVITWVPEYGPFPYHAFNAAQSHGDLANSEGSRLEKVFQSYVDEITL